MVFPIGLLALAAAAGAKPFYDDWVEGRQGKRAAGIMDAAGDDPSAQAHGFLQAGMLTPQQYLGFGQDQAQFGLQQQQLAQQASQFGQTFGLDQAKFGWQQAEAARERSLRMMGGGDGFDVLQGPVTQPVLDAMKTAVAGIESGGQVNPYAALGPEVAGRGRAIGKYQVMPENVGRWTQQALGQAMTPEEFAASPAAQEAVFEDQMTRNLNQYGTVEDALSVWHSGRPAAESLDATDGYMSTPDYIRRGAQVAKRQLGMAQYAQDQDTARRGIELEADDAAAPMIAARGRADQVLQGLDSIGRFGTGYLQSDEGKAEVDQMKSAATSLFYTWKNEVYGEAEPSPVTLEQLQAAFPTPGSSSWENRERLARYYGLMREELGRKAEYQRARVLYAKGLMSAEEYRSLNGGRLTQEERQDILRGNVAVPEGFREVQSINVPTRPQARQAAPLRGGFDQSGRYQ